MQKYDVVVVGGGPVGIIAAIAFRSRSGGALSVAVVDPYTRRKPSRVRTSALAQGSLAFIRELIGPKIDKFLVEVSRMEISTRGWAPPALPALCFESVTPLAHIVSHADFEPVFVETAEEAGVVFISDEAKNYRVDGSSAVLQLRSGLEVAATLLVAADGENSTLRSDAGIEVNEREYHRTAVVATLSHEAPHDSIALQIFYEAGPFALLPLEGNRSSMVWTETTRVADKLLCLDHEELRFMIQTKSKDRFGSIVAIEDGPYAFPLRYRHARRFFAPRLALVGDALRRVHPLAGQGLNLGMRDVAELCRLVFERATTGLDFGTQITLQHYEDRRRTDSVLTASAFDVMHDLFGISAPGSERATSFALRCADRSESLKRLLIKEAAGLNGDHAFPR